MFSTPNAATNVTSISEAPSAAQGVQGATRNGVYGETSRPGEDNSLHVALAIFAIGAVAVATGYLNIKVGK